MLRISQKTPREKSVKIAEITGKSPRKKFGLWLRTNPDYENEINGWSDNIKLEKNEEFEAIPRTDIIQKMYIVGPSGSGKSTYASKFIKKYLKQNKDNEFFLLSRVFEDDVLDKLDPFRIEINESLVNDPIEPEDVSEALVLFDDCALVKDKQLRNSVLNLQDSIAELGRHYKTTLVVVAHQLLDWKNSRVIINEASDVVIFPRGGSVQPYKQFLERYMGLSKKQIAEILKLKSRAIHVMKSYPNMILYNKGAFLTSSM
jgi:hypothetical protein